MARYTPLSLTAQTAYAQLFDAALGADMARTVANLRGSFAKKKIKGRDYWYFQYTDLGRKLRQIYVGPDSDEIRSLAQQSRARETGALAPLSRSAIALGCTPVLAQHYRVIRRLSDYGFFKAGGVLVGTHAFLAYGNMLGVRWGEASRTQDMDFAHAGKNLALALPANVSIDTHAAINSLQMGLLPMAGLLNKAGATYLNPKNPEFRLDFLTTLHRGGEKPYEHPQLGVALQPLKFMEYSLEHVVQAALFCAEGAVIVSVPHPARYALHKLLVYGERKGSYLQKSGKDLDQAAALLAFFKEHRAWEIDEAWADLIRRGPGWRTRAKHALAPLAKAIPELDVQHWLAIPKKRSTA
ncbi:MAG: hypothetical protein EXR27_10850 [Betaproteobacteria bacterium]|nr:hypothetical protein [Betaproteobacteria bacterium]